VLQQKAVQFQSQEGKKVICIMWQKAVQFQNQEGKKVICIKLYSFLL
jgi:hypothetical protein